MSPGDINCENSWQKENKVLLVCQAIIALSKTEPSTLTGVDPDFMHMWS